MNALAPGYFKTEMAPVDEPGFKRYWIDDAPMQRYAMPSELGALRGLSGLRGVLIHDW